VLGVFEGRRKAEEEAVHEAKSAAGSMYNIECCCCCCTGF
jgi:hypothetical protein